MSVQRGRKTYLENKNQVPDPQAEEFIIGPCWQELIFSAAVKWPLQCSPTPVFN